MNAIVELMEEIKGDHIYESGTLEGLMKLMGDNNETAMGTFDEFAKFIDSLDRGNLSYFIINFRNEISCT